MSGNRFIISRVCLPDYFFPFLPNTRNQFILENLCATGFISVYMVIDNEKKEKTVTCYNFAFARKTLKLMMKNHKPEVEVRSIIKVIISKNDEISNIKEEINYFKPIKYKKNDFEVSLISVNTPEKITNEHSEDIGFLSDKELLQDFLENILDEAFKQRDLIITENERQFLTNSIRKYDEVDLGKKPGNELKYKS
ncbi:hypothetical protein ACWL47_003999 [Yersinia enterocolitica]